MRNKRKRIIRRHKKNGVKFLDPGSVYIEEDVEIGSGTVIHPNVYLYTGTSIGRNCNIWPENHIFGSQIGDKCTLWPSISILNCRIGNSVEIHRGSRIVKSEVGKDTEIESNVVVKHSVIWEKCFVDVGSVVRNSKAFERCVIGPYAIVEEDSWLASGCKVGAQAHVHDKTRVYSNAEVAHTELVRSVVMPNARIKHFSYVGDAVVGNGSNIGAGTVFCNYNGSEKNRVKIGENVFVGSGTMLVAPLEIDRESFVAAGSVVPADFDIPSKSLVIARGQKHRHDSVAGTVEADDGVVVKEGYSHRKEGNWIIGKPSE